MFIDSFGLFQLPAATCLWIAVDRLLVHVEPVAPACQLMEVALFVALVVVVFYKRVSRWDRYLGMTAPMTQVPVPTAIIYYSAKEPVIRILLPFPNRLSCNTASKEHI